LTGLAAGAAVLSGLLLDASIAARFGAGSSTDAFFVGARLPLVLAAVMMVGANQALVPMISTILVEKGMEHTSRFVSRLFTATLLIGLGIALLGAVLAWPLMRVTAPGLASSDVNAAASVARVMFLLLPLISLAEILRAFLNARYAFVAPAAMNVVMNVLAASSILWLAHDDIQVVAWAYVGGALAQVCFMMAMAYRRQLRFRPELELRDPDVVAMARLSVRPLLAASLNPVARIGEQLFVSFLPPGSITILNYGYRLISAVGGSVFFRSVIVALVPRLTEATARGQRDELARLSRSGIRIMFAISVPLTALAATLAPPATLVVFNRGRFTRADAALLGLVLAVYASGLIGSGVQRALLAPFFARLDTRVPLRNSLYGTVANLVLLPPLLFFTHGDVAALLGVAIAYSISQYVNAAHAWYRLTEVIPRPLEGMAIWLARLGAAGLLTAGYLWAVSDGLELTAPTTRWLLALKTAFAAIGGIAVFGVLFTVLNRSETGGAWRLLPSRRSASASSVARGS
jgi:murein biosynthesis integral membrane protein MurJ